jgi:hypothetical protein
MGGSKLPACQADHFATVTIPQALTLGAKHFVSENKGLTI